MKTPNSVAWFAMLALTIVLAADLHAKAPPISAIPGGLPAKTTQRLEGRAVKLAAKRDSILADIATFNSKRKGVVVGSELDKWLTSESKRLDSVKEKYAAAVVQFNADVKEAVLITQMYTHEDVLSWDVKKRERLEKNLEALSPDGDLEATKEEIIQAWKDILARGNDAELAREATGGDGPAFPGAGTQSFNDCTIFALANATGRPYGVVAAQATDLLSKAKWRAGEGPSAQKVIEEHGLYSGEVIILAESFGQAEVVKSTEFGKTLKEGRPVLIGVVGQDGDFDMGHEVVLSKAFRHKGEDWYEMMDSNQDPQHRLYLSHKELGTILLENGVAYRADPGTTPKLLR